MEFLNVRQDPDAALVWNALHLLGTNVGGCDVAVLNTHTVKVEHKHFLMKLQIVRTLPEPV